METLTWTRFTSTLNRKLNPAIKSHLKDVYGCTAAALFTTGSGAYLATIIPALSGGLIPFLATIGFVIALNTTPMAKETINKRLAYLGGAAFCSGLSIGPLIELAIFVEPSLIITALLATSFIFGCFSLATILSDHYKWLYLYGTLSSGLSFLVMLSFANIFLSSVLIFQVQLYVGLIVMCGFIVFDTALIIYRFERGDRDYIEHAMMLFLDFLNVFNRILIILLSKESNKKKSSKKN